MNKYTLILSFVLISFCGFAQYNGSDTSTIYKLPDKEFTSLNFESENYKKSKEQGFELVGLKASECDENSDPYRLLTRIISYYIQNDTLTVLVGFPEVCCVSFLGDLKVLGNEIYLYYSTYGEECECRCCYSLEYKIRINKSRQNNYIFRLNDEKIIYTKEKYKSYPVKFDIINCDTINYVDKNGIKQGWFVLFNEKGDTINAIKYFNNLREETIFYFENGKRKSHTITKYEGKYPKTFEELEALKGEYWEWDADGSVIKHKVDE